VRRFDWRAWLVRLRRLWSRSLRIRIVAITVALSAIAVTIIGAYIATSVRTNLFESRKDQIVIEAGRAATSAQEVFTSAGEASEAQDLESVFDAAARAIRGTVTTAPLVYIRLRRSAYPKERLDEWREKIRGWVGEGLDVYAYVKHEDNPDAPRLALELAEGLG